MVEERPGPGRTDPTDDELEQLMRAGLAERAGQVDTDVPVPVNRSRSRRWVLPAAVAAAVGILVVGALVVPDGNVPVPPSDDRTRVANPPAPSDWRWESWHGVQVSVPPDWGWGGAPSPPEEFGESARSGNLYDCGMAAYRSADGKPVQDAALPYVGRPIMMTDACSVVHDQDLPQPTAPYAWLGASLEPGTRDLGGGWQQTTVKVGGSTVTVATKDDALRERILSTARANPGTDCEAELGERTVSDFTVDDPTGMSVCAYRRTEGSNGFPLQYATEVDAASTRTFLAAIDSAPKLQCIDSYTDEWVVLRIHGKEGKTQVVLVDTGDCIGIHAAKGTAELNVATTSPWAVDGIPAYVIGPRDTSEVPGLSDYFRGILG
ncbi:hypothetical protein [Microlunatus sp. GCM10028923]|uniref:hypothetical protein n=1 Tax=Microlunatus sp. GCM10028923 TaxID=3273400 RepID=UPI0036213B52